MDLKRQNILFLTRKMDLGGTEKVVLQLCEILLPQVNKIVICSCGGRNVAELDEMGIRHYEIPDIANKDLNTIKTAFFLIKKVIQKENISVIHSHHRMAAFYARVISDKRIVRIVNVHNTFYDKKIMTKFAYKGAEVVAVGNKVKKNLTEVYSLSDSRITVISNAVKAFSQDIKSIQELQEAKKKGCVIIGNIGRLTKQKGMEYFLRSIPVVKRQCKNVKFVIVGVGEEEDSLQQLAKELQVNNDLIFLGYRSDIQNVMSQLDFVVLSSLWEGFPLTPIEAFSVKKTIVATAVDGTPEIVKNEINGILVEKEDVADLAKAIIRLAKDEQLRNSYADNALKTFESAFSFEKMSEKYLAFYKKI